MQPQTFDASLDRHRGVISARILAFLIDYFLLGVIMVAFWVVYLVFGLATLGFGFIIAPIPFIVVAALYFGFTLGGPRQASLGMRVAGLRIERDNGQPVDMITAILHQVVFWALNTFLSPLVLIVGLFSRRGRLLHDMVLGTVMVRT